MMSSNDFHDITRRSSSAAAAQSTSIMCLEEHGTGDHTFNAANILNVHNGWVLVRQKPRGIAFFLRKQTWRHFQEASEYQRRANKD